MAAKGKGQRKSSLRGFYSRALDEAEKLELEEASHIALKTVANYLKDHPEIKLVRFVLFDSRTYQTYVDALKEIVLPG